MRDQGLNAPMMSGDGIVSAEFASIAGPGAEGTLMTFSPDPRKNPNAKDAVAKFKAKNFEPEAYTLYTYAAVQILAEAAKQAKSTDGKKMADVMKLGQALQDRHRRHLLRQEGRHHPSGLHHVRLEEGRRRQDRLGRKAMPVSTRSPPMAFSTSREARAHALHEGREGLHREGGEEERDAEPGRIDGEQRAPVATLVSEPATARMAARIGPMQGVQPKAKASPIR